MKPTPRLTLTVRNLGPIRQAALTLKTLTVVEGRHQSGTTRLATFAYAFVRALAGVPRLPIGSDVAEPELSPDLYRFLEMEAASGTPVAVPDSLQTALGRSLERPDLLVNEITSQFRHCFTVHDLQDLVRQNASPPDLTFEAVAADGPDPLWTIHGHLDSSALHLQGRLEGRLPQGFPKPSPKARFRYASIPTQASEKADGYAAARYLPASRGTLLALYRVVAAQIVSGLATREALPATLRGTEADFMQQLILTNLKTVNHRQQAICRKIETDVLGGRIAFHSLPDTGYPAAAFTPTGSTGQPLSQTSASVSALAPLSLAATHDLQPSDYLFLEEPETGLDPSAYTDLAFGLTRLAGAGLNVFVTTHQQELSRCLRLTLRNNPAQGLHKNDAVFYTIRRDTSSAINLHSRMFA